MLFETLTSSVLHKLTGITVIRHDLCPIEVRVRKNGHYVVLFPNGGNGWFKRFANWKLANKAIKEWTKEHSTRQCRVIYPLIWK